MQFEHLVQVNDINDSSDFYITRSQLWQGLLLRAREPNLFLEAVESFVLLEDGDNYLKRELNFPGSVVNDEVFLNPENDVRYKIVTEQGMPAASLDMFIEEPEENSLFVRFVYQVEGQDGAESQASYDSVVQQAYVNTDLDSIRLIKQRYMNQ